VRSADWQIIEEMRYPTRQLGEYLAKRPLSRVVIETCAEAFFVALRRSTATSGAWCRRLWCGRKLSEVSCRVDLPSVHGVQDKEARFWRDSNVPIEPRHRRRQDLITSLTSTTILDVALQF
jgi:hypothetical protein